MKYAIFFLVLFLPGLVRGQLQMYLRGDTAPPAPPSNCLTTGIDTRFGNSNDVYGIWGECTPLPCGVFMSAQYVEMTAGDELISECVNVSGAGVTQMEFDMTFSWGGTGDRLIIYYSLDSGSSWTQLADVNGSANPEPFTVSLSAVSSETDVVFRVLRPTGSASTEFIDSINFN